MLAQMLGDMLQMPSPGCHSGMESKFTTALHELRQGVPEKPMYELGLIILDPFPPSQSWREVFV